MNAESRQTVAGIVLAQSPKSKTNKAPALATVLIAKLPNRVKFAQWDITYPKKAPAKSVTRIARYVRTSKHVKSAKTTSNLLKEFVNLFQNVAKAASIAKT
jgi:hypothetical protein